MRRELDNRFLDRSGLSQPITLPPGGPQSNPPTSIATSLSGPTSSQTTPPGSANSTPGPQQSSVPFLRQELHHHQHQHTHLHQHQHQHQSLLPAAPNASLFPPPLFKDIPKIGAADSPFYRTGPALVGMPPYPYGSGILHPGLSGPTQFVPPSHLQSFVPKVNISDGTSLDCFSPFSPNHQYINITKSSLASFTNQLKNWFQSRIFKFKSIVLISSTRLLKQFA